jgi:hypothetical protein
MAQSRGECNALANVPQKVDVPRSYRIVFEGHTGRRFISVKRMRSNDTKVFAQAGCRKAVEDRHDERRNASNPERPIHPFVLGQSDFQAIKSLFG